MRGGDATAEAIWPRLRRNAGVILGGRAASGLINLAAAAVAVRAVGIEGFGVVALLQAYVRVLAGLLRFESWAAVTRYGPGLMASGDSDGLRRLMGFTLRLDAIAFAASVALAAALAPVVGRWFGWPPEFAALAPLYAVTLIFITGATPTGFLRLVDRFRVLAEQHALNAVIRLAGAGLVLALGFGVSALVAAWAAAGILSGVYMMRAAWIEARARGLAPRWRGRWSDLAAGFPNLRRFVALTNATAVVETVTSHAAVLIAGAVLGPAGASLYSLARQISDALGKLSPLLGQIILPELAGLEARGDRRTLRRVVRRTLQVSALGLAAVMAGLWAGGEALLVLLFGPEAAAAAPLLLGAGAAASLAACGFALGPALLSLGRETAVFRTALVATLVFAPLLMGLLHLNGLTGAGIALVVWQSMIFAGRLSILRAELRRGA